MHNSSDAAADHGRVHSYFLLAIFVGLALGLVLVLIWYSLYPIQGFWRLLYLRLAIQNASDLSKRSQQLIFV